MGKKQALGWLGAGVCSIALVVAGGLAVGSVAVHRYLQSSGITAHAAPASATTDPAAQLRIQDAVTAIIALPGVATASSSMRRSTSTATDAMTSPSAGSAGYSYDVSVIMTPGSGADEAAEVVATLARDASDGDVDLELSAPAGGGRAASVIDFDNAFGTAVSRSSIEAIARAVQTVSAVPGLKSLRVTVPYTWNMQGGDLSARFESDASAHEQMLREVLAQTVLKDVQTSG